MANAPLSLGWFHPGALESIETPTHEGESMYAAVLKARHEAGYWYHGWPLRHQIFLAVSDQWKKLDNSVIEATAHNLERFVEASHDLIPWTVRTSAYAKSASWALFLAAPHNTVFEPLSRGFKLPRELKPGVARKSQNNVAWVSRKTGAALSYNTDKSHGILGRIYNAFAAYAEGFYVFLVTLGLFAYLLSSWRGYLIPLFCFSVFFANIVLNVYVQYVVARYVMVLDLFLFLGVTTAFYCLYKEFFAGGKASDPNART